jgi:hypothetical protein
MKRISTLLSAAAIVAALCLPTLASAASIYSKDILPADGTTGQTLTTGKGIKTGHIQNGAVTNQKIADGAVTAAKLGITCPAGQYLQFSGTSWVCSVGTAGPQGPVGPQGIPGATGPQGPAAHYANVIVVAKSGGDFTDPIAAVNSITDASDANPYLVKIMPGIYDLSGTITMRENIDLVGAGENVTKLRQTTDATTIYFASTINSTANDIPTKSSLKNLSIEAVVAPNRSVIDMVMSSPIIENVNILSLQGGVGIVSGWGSPHYKNVSLNLSGYFTSCVESQSSFTTIDNMRCTSTGGSYNLGIRSYVNPVTIKNSTFNTTHQAVAIQGMNDTPPVINLVNTQIVSGTLDKWLGVIKCLGTYDNNLNLIACPQ